MRHVYRNFALAGCLLLFLSACGGGGSGNGSINDISTLPWPVDSLDMARSLTGGDAPPDITSDQIEASLEALTNGADSLLMNDVLLFTDSNSSDRIDVSCGTMDTCSLSYAGETETFSLSDIRDGVATDITGESQAVMTRQDVTLAQGRGRGSILNDEATVFGYGGWLQHSYFVIEWGSLEANPFAYAGSYSIGDVSGSTPQSAGGSGEWRGVMVGGDVSNTSTRGNVIQGDATITIADFNNPKADVAFTNIYDLDTGRERSDMNWNGLNVTDGAFQSGSGRDSLSGRFYGPQHEEVGGVFERNDVLGSFGATRQ